MDTYTYNQLGGNRVVKFDIIKMEKFIAQDRFLKFSYKNLKERNPNVSENEMMEIVFNSEVLGDSQMENEYKKM